MIWRVLANLGRRLTEWAERHADAHDRHVIDLLREIYGCR